MTYLKLETKDLQVRRYDSVLFNETGHRIFLLYIERRIV
jgi:hypothetical protein